MRGNHGRCGMKTETIRKTRDLAVIQRRQWCSCLLYQSWLLPSSTDMSTVSRVQHYESSVSCHSCVEASEWRQRPTTLRDWQHRLLSPIGDQLRLRTRLVQRCSSTTSLHLDSTAAHRIRHGYALIGIGLQPIDIDYRSIIFIYKITVVGWRWHRSDSGVQRTVAWHL